MNSKKLGVQAPQKVKLCYEAPIPKSCREQSYRRQPIIWPNKIELLCHCHGAVNVDIQCERILTDIVFAFAFFLFIKYEQTI